MQLGFSCVPSTFCDIEKTLSAARLARYLPSSDGDKNHALRLYVWNARLCEAFYLPTQLCEVAFRNAVSTALRSKHGENWHQRGSFLCTLPQRLKNELDEAMRTERAAYGAAMNSDHLVSGLSLGFWLHLLTKNYDGVFWPVSFPTCFPHKPPTVSRQALYDKVDKFRVHRNRIAHHKPIFDRSPSAEYASLLELVSWICTETHWFLKTVSTVAQTINDRPSA